ncbi:MAG TPA: zf-TFIIB domain-containing protein [Gammaproteobacteria bacterium]|nr:zf-TFIIB domain-containing protein [Gammaproteobacteria bacterium]
MECPKCGHRMEQVVYSDIEVDRCTLCKGLWFDVLEHEELKVIPGAESIDTGDPEVGAIFNRDDRIRCPRCAGPMIRMVVPDQPHIWYESCGTCHGVYFDAGEFTDFKKHTLGDFFRRLRAAERR